ncbi:hypothetical protein [Saccharothrix longispora]|uniref:hypothetical protein n=1 Tax=Saccharothrix longispora TaxID=33920 RepID=UPI002905B2BA|nr:hypothetical protein [Saccharothrix longispora]
MAPTAAGAAPPMSGEPGGPDRAVPHRRARDVLGRQASACQTLQRVIDAVVVLKGASEALRRGFDRFRADLDGVARLGPRDE